MHFAALTVDCTDATTTAAFYRDACGAEIEREDADSVWVRLAGGLVIFRAVPDHRPPTWPSADVPIQMHMEFWVDDLDAAELRLHALGATTAEYQPNREGGLLVMLDPAGHPFCVGVRG